MPDESEIDEMSRLCAAHCLESLDPHHCIACFIERLVTIRGWAQPDANQVAHFAIEMMARALGDESLVENA
ncbi:MAG: hypothetical protein WD894_16435 [Pirellulales bacterium]